jgi:hypothetical protein
VVIEFDIDADIDDVNGADSAVSARLVPFRRRWSGSSWFDIKSPSSIIVNALSQQEMNHPILGQSPPGLPIHCPI